MSGQNTVSFPAHLMFSPPQLRSTVNGRRFIYVDDEWIDLIDYLADRNMITTLEDELLLRQDQNTRSGQHQIDALLAKLYLPKALELLRYVYDHPKLGKGWREVGMAVTYAERHDPEIFEHLFVYKHARDLLNAYKEVQCSDKTPIPRPTDDMLGNILAKSAYHVDEWLDGIYQGDVTKDLARMEKYGHRSILNTPYVIVSEIQKNLFLKEEIRDFDSTTLYHTCRNIDVVRRSPHTKKEMTRLKALTLLVDVVINPTLDRNWHSVGLALDYTALRDHDLVKELFFRKASCLFKSWKTEMDSIKRYKQSRSETQSCLVSHSKKCMGRYLRNETATCPDIILAHLERLDRTDRYRGDYEKCVKKYIESHRLKPMIVLGSKELALYYRSKAMKVVTIDKMSQSDPCDMWFYDEDVVHNTVQTSETDIKLDGVPECTVLKRYEAGDVGGLTIIENSNETLAFEIDWIVLE